MTDSPETTNTESLIAEYEAGVANRESGDPIPWLNARTEIDTQLEQLTSGQAERVQKADRTLIENAGQVAARLAGANMALRDQRAKSSYTPDQWWWYLDVLANVSDYYETAKPNPRGVWLSRLFTVFEVGVLLVALFLLARSFNLIPTPTPAAVPTVTAGPSATPAPTATIDAAALDITTGTTYKSPHDLVEISLPKNWQNNVDETQAQYVFTYDASQRPPLFIQLTLGDLTALFTPLGITVPLHTPEDGLQAIKKNPPSPQFKLTDVQAAKIGNLDAKMIGISIPASAQAEATEIELIAATLPNGQSALLYVQGNTSLWNKGGKDTLDKMIASVVINTQNMTPTPTLSPLLITATSFQQQILALTPTATPTSVPTQVATGAATGAATSAPTNSPATPASTAAATSPAQ